MKVAVEFSVDRESLLLLQAVHAFPLDLRAPQAHFKYTYNLGCAGRQNVFCIICRVGGAETGGVCGGLFNGDDRFTVGGKFATMAIAGTYTEGQNIDITVNIYTNHVGSPIIYQALLPTLILSVLVRQSPIGASIGSSSGLICRFIPLSDFAPAAFQVEKSQEKNFEHARSRFQSFVISARFLHTGPASCFLSCCPCEALNVA